MQRTPLLSLDESNKVVESLIASNKPFVISRIGDSIATVALSVYYKTPLNQHAAASMASHDGIYHSTKQHVELFAKHYNNGMIESDAMACFETLCADRQNEYLKIKVKKLSFSSEKNDTGDFFDVVLKSVTTKFAFSYFSL